MIIDIGASGQYSALDIAAVTEELVKGGTLSTDSFRQSRRGLREIWRRPSRTLVRHWFRSRSGGSRYLGSHEYRHPSIVSSELALVDAAKAADIFTVAANQSAADTTDIIAGLRTFGPVAAGMGIGFGTRPQCRPLHQLRPQRRPSPAQPSRRYAAARRRGTAADT